MPTDLSLFSIVLNFEAKILILTLVYDNDILTEMVARPTKLTESK